MQEADAVNDMNLALQALHTWLATAGLGYVIVGGLAVSLISQPRVTQDIDAAVWIDRTDLAKLLNEGERYGIYPRLSNSLEFAQRSRVLLLQHKANDSAIATPLDVSLAALPFEQEMIERAQYINIGNVKLPIATAEDLIVMKMLALRSRDIADIETLLRFYPTLDRKRIRHWVTLFAETLEMPEMTERLEVFFQKIP